MVLVTGGNGVVGVQLAARLVRKGRKVRVLAMARFAADADLRALDVEVRHGDVTRSGDVNSAMEGVDTVYHLAAVLSSPENPSRFAYVNVEGTQRVLNAAVSHGVRHFIFVSSISVTYPRLNPYSTSKLEAEARVRQSSLAWTIARPCLVLGGAEHRAFLEGVRRWPVLALPFRGAVRKRPIASETLAEALARMENNMRCVGKTYALGGHGVVSLRRLAEAEWEKTGTRKPVIGIPVWPLWLLAAGAEFVSRATGRRLSWLCRQSVDGLVFDADANIDAAREDLDLDVAA